MGFSYCIETPYSLTSLGTGLVIYDDVVTQEKENNNMEKKFAVLNKANFKYKTLEEAEKDAKRMTGNNGEEYVIAQALAVTLQPVPEIEVVKL